MAFRRTSLATGPTRHTQVSDKPLSHVDVPFPAARSRRALESVSARAEMGGISSDA